MGCGTNDQRCGRAQATVGGAILSSPHPFMASASASASKVLPQLPFMVQVILADEINIFILRLVLVMVFIITIESKLE